MMLPEPLSREEGRKCIYCGVPIYECMGYVLPRDILLAWEGRWPKDKLIRELCSKFICNEKWLSHIYEEMGQIKPDKIFIVN
jgi:hypothetical protein